MCPVSPSSNSTSTASESSSSSSLEEPGAQEGLLGWAQDPWQCPPHRLTPPSLTSHHIPRIEAAGFLAPVGTDAGAGREAPAGLWPNVQDLWEAACQGLWGPGPPPRLQSLILTPPSTHRLLQQLLLRVDVLPVPPLTLDDDAVAGEGAQKGFRTHLGALIKWLRPL